MQCDQSLSQVCTCVLTSSLRKRKQPGWFHPVPIASNPGYIFKIYGSTQHDFEYQRIEEIEQQLFKVESELKSYHVGESVKWKAIVNEYGKKYLSTIRNLNHQKEQLDKSHSSNGLV